MFVAMNEENMNLPQTGSRVTREKERERRKNDEKSNVYFAVLFVMISQISLVNRSLIRGTKIREEGGR